MTLRVDFRTADVTIAVSGRTSHELLAALGSIGHRLDEGALEEWLGELEQQGLSTHDSAGRWTLTAQAMRAFGRGLAEIENPNDAHS